MQNSIAAPVVDTATEWVSYMVQLGQDMENTKRKRISKKLVDYYNNNQKDYLNSELSKIYTDPYSFITKRKWTQPYTKQLVDNIAQCYGCKIRRELPIRSKKVRVEVDKRVFHGLNPTMDTANKNLILERMALLFCKWSEKYQRIVYKTLNQFQYDLVFDPTTDEKELQAVIVSDYKPIESCNYIVYTRNKTYRFYGYKLIEEIQHNLGVVPFVVMYAEDPGFEDYLLPNELIADNNLELNIANSNLLNMLQNKVHGVWVLNRPAEEEHPGIDDADPNLSTPTRVESDRRLPLHDPGYVFELTSGPNGESSDLKVVSPDTDFEGAINTVKFLADSFANTFGEDGSIFESKVNDNPATLYKINEKKRQSRLQVYQARFQDAEKELFSKAYLLAKMANQGLPNLDTRELVVEFVLERLMVESINMQDLLNALDKGVLDKVEVIRQLFPTLNRDEAIEFIGAMDIQDAIIEEKEEQINNKTQ